MSELTEHKNVIGELFTNSGDKYLVTEMVKLADDNGDAVEGFGWLATNSVPINQDVIELDPEAELVYDMLVLIIGGTFISSMGVPKTISVLKEFDWDGIDEYLDNVIERLHLNNISDTDETVDNPD